MSINLLLVNNKKLLNICLLKQVLFFIDFLCTECQCKQSVCL